MELFKRCALCNGYKSLSSQQKVRIGMIAIFFLVFILLGLVHSSWGFIHDDFGVLWHSKVNSWKDIFKFFYENSTICVVQPSNYQIPPQSFFSVYYRPLSYVFYALQMYFFNFEPYGYFLVRIFIHALNSSLLFYLFSYTTYRLHWAFFGAMAFAFHSSLAGYEGIGWIAAQVHTVVVFLLLLSIIFVIKYNNTSYFRYLFFSLVCFLLSLFFIETGLFFPFIIALGLLLYSSRKYLWIKVFFSYVIVAIGYLLLRFALYTSSEGSMQSFLNRLNPSVIICDRFYEIITFLCDIFSIQLYHSLVKILFLLIIFFSIFYLFYLSKKKILLVSISFCFLILFWPALLRYYTNRYLYIVLPFFILYFLIAWTDVFKKSKKIYLFFSILACCFIGKNIIYTTKSLFYVEQKIHIPIHALKKMFDKKLFFENKKCKNDALSLCFIGMPLLFFRTGIAQSVWMHDKTLLINKVFCDQATILLNHSDDTLLHIKKNINGFDMEVLKGNAFFWTRKDAALTMGNCIIHETEKSKTYATNMTYTLDQKWLEYNPYFITWDYQKNEFKLLGKLNN